MNRWLNVLYSVGNAEYPINDGKLHIVVRKGTDILSDLDKTKHFFWPIPIKVISQNPAIGQNADW